MESEATNIKGNYPLGGDLIGPAWREIWKRLSVNRWICGTDLALELAPQFKIQPATVKTLLRTALHEGVLEVKREVPSGRTRAANYYRVTKKGAGR